MVPPDKENKEKRAAIRVLIADDHPIVRQGIVTVVSRERGIEVVGEASNGREAVEMTASLEPDIVLMDLDMPEMNGLEAIERLKDLFPEAQSVLVSIHDEDEYLPLALEAGAIDFIDKRKFTPQRVRRALALAS